MNVAQSLWRKIPLHIRIIIISSLSGVFLLFLLIVSCSGSMDSYTKEVDDLAMASSEAFAIKWQKEGQLQEIYDFDNGDQPKIVGVMYLSAKKTVKVSGLTIGTSTLKQDITFKVVAIGLPVEGEQGEQGEQGEGNEQPEEEETEIGSYTLKSGSSENQVFLNYVIPENLIIILKFTPEISLEFIGVYWTAYSSGD